MYAYLVDLGFLLDKKDKEFSFYASVYDHKHGYYDTNQYYVPTLEKAKKDALNHINENINNNPYSVVSITVVPDNFDFDDSYLEDERYFVENVVFSVRVENGKIKENFIIKEGEEKIMANNFMYEKLKNHIGHNIVCVAYGDTNNPNDICIECEDCNEVLVSSETFEEESKEGIKMDFYIASINDNGSGVSFTKKEDVLKEISLMIDDCIVNGGTQFDITVDADASCYYQEEK